MEARVEKPHRIAGYCRISVDVEADRDNTSIPCIVTIAHVSLPCRTTGSPRSAFLAASARLGVGMLWSVR